MILVRLRLIEPATKVASSSGTVTPLHFRPGPRQQPSRRRRDHLVKHDAAKMFAIVPRVEIGEQRRFPSSVDNGEIWNGAQLVQVVLDERIVE